MEAVPRLPMLSFDLRVSTEPADFAPKLKQYIRSHYNEDPELYAKEINQLEGLRSAAVRPSKDVPGCSALKRYYCQLHFLASRFPMYKDGEAAVKFSWKDLYANMVCSLPDISLEMVSILYNIGALHSQLGAADNRTSADGMKMSCTHFQCAAWAFQHIREEYPQAMGLDLSPDMMSFMHQLCLAQAQECILEKSMMDNRKPTIIAKVAVQTVEYYKQTLKLLVECPADDNSFAETISSKLYKKWEKYLKFKIGYHGSIALLFQGQQAEEQQKMGERVAYYQAAFDKLEEAKKLSKGLDNMEAVNEALTFVHDVIEGKRKAAKNENEFIYHDEVPNIQLLPDIKGASLVKGIPFNINDSEVSGPDIFARIVPMKAHESSSLYSEEKAKLLRKMGAMIENKDEELETFLSTLQLDELNVKLMGNRLPQELVDRCAALSAKQNAIQNLVDAMNKLSDIYHDVEGMLTDIKEMLHDEEVHEKEYQQVIGKRPPSIAATDLTREAKKYQEAHAKASESNQTLHKAMVLHIANLKLLSLPLKELEKQIPSVVIESPEAEAIFNEMQHLMNKVEEMKKQRITLSNQLRESVCHDDITRQVVTYAGECLQTLFQQELQKHQKYVSLIEQNLAAQENILKAVKDAYARYGATRKGICDLVRRRESVIASLMASYDAYEDLLAKSSKGLDFYRKLETNVGKLLQRVKGTCKVQDEEREQLMKNVKSAEPQENAPSTGGNLKLKDYLNIKKETGKLSLEYSPSSSVNPYYNTDAAAVATPQNWMPGIRPAPVGSEETETKDFYQARDQNYATDADEKLRYYPHSGTTSQYYPASEQAPPKPNYYNADGYSNYGNQTQPYDYNQASASNYVPSYASTQTTISSNVYSTASGYQSINNYPNSYVQSSNYVPPQLDAYNAYASVPATQKQFTGYSSDYNNVTADNANPPMTSSQNAYSETYSVANNYISNYGAVAASNSYGTTVNSNNYVPAAGNTAASVVTASNSNYGAAVNSNNNSNYIPAAGTAASSNNYGTVNSNNYIPAAGNTAAVGATASSNNYETVNSSNYIPAAETAASSNNYGTTVNSNSSNYIPAAGNAAAVGTAVSSNNYGAVNSNSYIPAAGSANYGNEYVPPVTTNNYLPPVSNYAATATNANYTLAAVTDSNYVQPASALPVSNPSESSLQYPNYLPQNYSAPDSTPQNNYVAPQHDAQTWQQQQACPNENYFQTGNESLYTASQTPNDYAMTDSETYKNADGSNYETYHGRYYTAQYGEQAEYHSYKKNPMTYMQAGTERNLQNTFTTFSSNDACKSSPSSERSNVDLLAGLDFNVNQSPLVPESTNSAGKEEAKVETSAVKSEALPLKELEKAEVAKLNLTKEVAAQEKTQTKDSLTDVETLKQFAQDVEKYEKFVEGLTLKTLNGPTNLDLKWKEITDLQDKSSHLHIISVARCYPMKNRFPDILPYDDSRVELPSTKDDYINASKMRDLTKHSPPFVLTQAPLPSTYSDFWAMVFEQQVEVIVCLVSDSELNGHVYLPTEKGQELDAGRLKISLQSSNARSHWIERILSICVVENRAARVVVHLQFTAWPGSSFPASPGPFLSFTSECINFFSQQRSYNHPVVVHCMSGVGRTGLFCLVVAALLDIQAGKGIPDLVAISARMSQFRKNCLRDREHLKFAYQTVLYYSQDLLMKRGILTSRSSFEDKKLKEGKCHTRHPSEDFLLGPPTDLTQLQCGIEKLGFDSVGKKNEADNRTSGTARSQSACSRRSSFTNSSGRSSPSSLPPDVLSSLDPATFTLKIEPNKSAKKRFTPESFMRKSQTSLDAFNSSSDDPLSRLDPLWTLKK